MPDGAVYVGRPTRWGNPWPVGRPGIDGSVMPNAQAAVDRYESSIDRVSALPTRDDIRRELAGRDLVCWCALDQPCHADVLMKIANHSSIGEPQRR
jgi:hypothetical protein